MFKFLLFKLAFREMAARCVVGVTELVLFVYLI